MKLCFVSIANCGTRGHWRLVSELAMAFSTAGNTVHVVSEDDYEHHSNLVDTKIRWKRIQHRYLDDNIAGSIRHPSSAEMYDYILSASIDVVVFSTFYDIELVKKLRSGNIKCLLITYPFRDWHQQCFVLNRFDRLFSGIVVLNDVSPLVAEFAEMVETATYKPGYLDRPEAELNSANGHTNILVTCGGGTLASAAKLRELFNDFLFGKAGATGLEGQKPQPPQQRLQRQDLSKLNIRFLQGAAVINQTDMQQSDQQVDASDLQQSTEPSSDQMMQQAGYRNRIEYRPWSDSIQDDYRWADILVSEAGFFTVSEIINLRKMSILIPGARSTDNQELRAATLASMGMGRCVMPGQGADVLSNHVESLVEQYQNRNDEICRACASYAATINAQPSMVQVVGNML